MHAMDAGLPSPVPKIAIRGSVSDNSHERFSAPHTDDEPAEASSSGVISHIVLVRFATLNNAPSSWDVVPLMGRACCWTCFSGGVCLISGLKKEDQLAQVTIRWTRPEF